MIELNYSRKFNTELLEIVSYFKNNISVEAANKLVDSIFSSINLLSYFPRIGKFRAIDYSINKEFYLLVTGHYFIYYSVCKNIVSIDGIKDTRTGDSYKI